ncbi:hypothetical protein Glove_355g43 [Diversispora epigaea]|uniref:Integrase zinc-binding domain-containing protein n=1 Tax=Diversispora epigaea TaxID=1348612 RepID=A0A397HE69_9GLOM|nr:hypothetical protein Glove_355g43 [Diversispora epigaea]
MSQYYPDLIRLGSYTVKQIDRPYNLNNTWETSAQQVYQQLQIAMRTRDRLMTLVTANFPTKEGLELAENNLLTRLFTLTDELPVIRGQTQKQIEKQQSKQKEYHDRQIKNIKRYQIGDKVLMYDAAKHTSHTGKLEPKWKGPFYIHNKLNPGVYKLRTLEGKVLLAPINGSLLKMYYERSTWEPQIVITS